MEDQKMGNEEGKAVDEYLSTAQKYTTIPRLVNTSFIPRGGAVTNLAAAPDTLSGNAKMIIKGGLKAKGKKATPVRFFRINNKAWGIIVGDY